MKRQLVVPFLAVGLTALAGLGLAIAWPRAPLDAQPTSQAALPARLVCYGYVDSPHGPLLLQPARAGRVSQVLVKEKQTVRKGDPLVQLDDNLIQMQEEEAELAVQAAHLQLTKAKDGLKQYEAKKAQAEAALEAAQSKVLEAQYALARREELVKKELASHVEVDVGGAQLNEAKALVKVEQNRLAELKAVNPELEVQLAHLQLNRSKAQLNRVRKEREEYLLQAPVDGLVLRVQTQAGDLVSPASPRPAVWLALTGAWIVRAEVSQEFAGRVGEGMPVQVEDEANTSMLARGKITEVSGWFLPRRQLSLESTSINTGLTVECVIALERNHHELRLGQRVRVRVLADVTAGQPHAQTRPLEE